MFHSSWKSHVVWQDKEVSRDGRGEGRPRVLCSRKWLFSRYSFTQWFLTRREQNYFASTHSTSPILTFRFDRFGIGLGIYLLESSPGDPGVISQMRNFLDHGLGHKSELKKILCGSNFHSFVKELYIERINRLSQRKNYPSDNFVLSQNFTWKYSPPVFTKHHVDTVGLEHETRLTWEYSWLAKETLKEETFK